MFQTSTATVADSERLLYNTRQTMEILAMSHSTLYRELSRGKLRGILVGSHTRRFPRTELEAYVAARQAEVAMAQK